MPKETTRVASTPLRGLFPLGAAGDRSHGRIVDALIKRLGPKHAAVLAEPEPVADGSAVDWYVSGEAKGVRIADLDPASGAAAEAELERISSDILHYADELSEPSRSATERSLAVALRNALKVPGRDYVYVVDGQPVLVAWAHRRDEEQALPVGLVHRHELPPASAPRPSLSAAGEGVTPPTPQQSPPPTPSPTPRRLEPLAVGRAVVEARPHSWRWLWWVLFSALVAAIMWTLLRACALNIGNVWLPGIAWCGSNTSWSASPGQIADLQALITDLEAQLARRAQECPLQMPPTTRQAQQTPKQAPNVDAKEIQDRVKEAGGASGELQISLGWNGPADLDLYVRCASGQTISYGNNSACGGTLDVDMNAERKSNTPVENIRFPSISEIPPGTLTIGIGWYADHGDTRDVIPATIVVRRPGQPPREIKVDLRRPATPPGAPVTVDEITIPR